ncbi:LysR family transcriptional regulator [Staphylococcus xylosus]|uniref:LysR family transcriptional regulator n=1 Tax=Staphylococcus xylosus TaxID=1288 RepID=A0A939SPT1_STAXY|nr:LysR family transcriptional regulator [Staphylococcus xylosus]
MQNITQTSKTLRTSQPAVSYRINKIEQEFNVKIIHRNKRSRIHFSRRNDCKLCNFHVKR